MKTKVHYRFHKIPPLDPILSPLNLVLTLKYYFINIRFNIIFPRTIGCLKRYILFRLTN
jgi:hypothetical protein